MKRMTKIIGITASAAVIIIIVAAAVSFAQQQIRLTTIMPTQTQMRGISGVVGSNGGAWDWRTLALTDDQFYVGGNIGIGKINPQAQLDIYAGPSRPQISLGDLLGSWSLWNGANFHIMCNQTTGDWYRQTDLLIDGPTGNVLIGSMMKGIASPHALEKLQVKGRVMYQTGPAGSPTNYVMMSNASLTSGYIEWAFTNIDSDGDSTGTPTRYYSLITTTPPTPSSKRFKENIKNMELDSSKIYDLEPVSFNWKKERGGGRDFGLIAEDVAKISPLLVSYDNDGKPFSVKYDLLSVLLLNELKKKSAEIKTINEAVKAQAKEIESIKLELNNLKK